MDRTDGQRERSLRYAGIGLTSGAGVGVLVGALVGGSALALGVCFGAGVGLVMGAALDAQHRDATR